MKRSLLALALALVPSSAACAGAAPVTTALDDDAITVASFNFPESVLLAEIYAQALEAAGFDVERELDLGPRELVAPSLLRGLIEVVPEYSGSALEFLAGAGSASPDPAVTSAALAHELERRGVLALAPAPAEDRNGFVVTRETAATYGLVTLSDLEEVAGSLTFGGPPECPTRSLCLLGLEATYGVRFGEVVALDEGGRRTVAALVAGDIDVGLLFTSDGAIQLNGFVLLQDDRHLEPAENVTPLIRPEVVERFGDGPVRALDAVSAELTTGDLRAMNAAVASGAMPPEVAAAWLAARGLTGVGSAASTGGR